MSSKLLFFILTITLIAIVYGFVLANFNLEEGLIFLPISFAVGFVFLALFLIQCLLFNNLLEIFGIIFLETLAMAAPLVFLKNFNYFVGIASVVMFIILIVAHETALFKTKNMIKIHFWGLRKTVLSKAIIGITLFSVLSYVSFFNLKTLVLPPNIFFYFETPIETVGRVFVKDFSLKMNAGEFLQKFAEKSLPEEVTRLSLSQRNSFIDQAVGQLSLRIKDLTHVQLDLREPVGEAVYQITNFQLKRIPVASRTPFLFSVSAVLFLFITGFSFFFSWVIILLAWLIYHLLLLADFIRISHREESVEKIII